MFKNCSLAVAQLNGRTEKGQKKGYLQKVAFF
jgi:hypothetical protein